MVTTSTSSTVSVTSNGSVDISVPSSGIVEPILADAGHVERLRHHLEPHRERAEQFTVGPDVDAAAVSGVICGDGDDGSGVDHDLRPTDVTPGEHGGEHGRKVRRDTSPMLTSWSRPSTGRADGQIRMPPPKKAVLPTASNVVAVDARLPSTSTVTGSVRSRGDGATSPRCTAADHVARSGRWRGR